MTMTVTSKLILPLSSERLSEVATSGFKRLYMNRSDGSDKPRGTSKPRTRLIVQPYSDRKAKRLRLLTPLFLSLLTESFLSS
jgi:hypothetical protein